jgi:hypothetical protein
MCFLTPDKSDMDLDEFGIGWELSSHWCGDIDDIGDEF